MDDTHNSLYWKFNLSTRSVFVMQYPLTILLQNYYIYIYIGILLCRYRKELFVKKGAVD